MAHIQVLSKEVSELIAAGEVIDRPASVIKELLENAIDANASVITVEIKNGGRTYIRVTDNGKGIAAEDISKAFLRHATSKIVTKEDLVGIVTLGFRGEALASISAVSRVDVLTKPKDDMFGTHYIIEGCEEKLCEQSGCPDGTTFVVRDIFYNVPARLKFLKKDTSEGNNVAGLVSKLALSHPEISFKFIRDNNPELITAGDGKLYSSINSVFGREFAASLIPVDSTWNGIRVSGYIVRPLWGRPNRKFQNFFVNGRFVKSKTCCGALEEGYRNKIMVGKFPACVLNIESPPEIVDVNVHPTKIEVRFSDDKMIYEAVYFAVKDALLKDDKPVDMTLDKKRHFTDRQLYDLPPKSQGEQLKFITVEDKPASPVAPAAPAAPKEAERPAVKITPPTLSKAPVEKPQKVDNPAGEDLFLKSLMEDMKAQTKAETPAAVETAPMPDDNDAPLHYDDSAVTEGDSVTAEQEIIEQIQDFKYISNASFERRSEIVAESYKEPVKPVVIGELFKTYIVAQAGDEMLLFDKHASHERYLFEKIKDNAKELDTQMFLEPVYVMLSYDEYDALSANVEAVNKLGFAVEPDVAPNVAVRGVPIILGDENPTDIITMLAKNFIDCKHDPQLEIFDELLHSIACKAAIKANDDSDILELQALVNNVYGNDEIRYCPHGRPIMIRLKKRDLEKQFRRVF
ncbi:MAG: DNA mismatch repair endonuclease MutL [Ruminococcus sp.]|nr:DNA mismatch repair endonuclease MutL [Ruminococcus sp.]